VGDIENTPEKKKAACKAFFAPLAVCPLALIEAREKEKRQAVKLAAVLVLLLYHKADIINDCGNISPY
jgi:hypothetical protein